MQQYIQTFRTILIVAFLLATIWFFKDWQFQREENKRQTENASQLRKADSLKFISQILNKQEINEYLEYQNKSLQKKLEKDNIKLNRIESIISNNYSYRDTISSETDITALVAAIQNSIPKTQEWSDTTKCMTIKGNVSFDGQNLKVTVDDREFKNISEGVVYWERRKWNFLGIKTRFLGKKQFTAKTYNDCGESQILKIEKKE